MAELKRGAGQSASTEYSMKYDREVFRSAMRHLPMYLILMAYGMAAGEAPTAAPHWTPTATYGVEARAIQIAPGIPVDKMPGLEDSEDSSWTPLQHGDLLLNAHRLRVDGKQILNMGMESLAWQDDPSPTALDLGRGSTMIDPGHAIHLYLERKPRGFTHGLRIQIEAPDTDGFISVHFTFAPLDAPLIFRSDTPTASGTERRVEADFSAVPNAWFCFPDQTESGETILLFARIVHQPYKPCGQ